VNYEKNMKRRTMAIGETKRRAMVVSANQEKNTKRTMIAISAN
jgi:hypothetical protein